MLLPESHRAFEDLMRYNDLVEDHEYINVFPPKYTREEEAVLDSVSEVRFDLSIRMNRYGLEGDPPTGKLLYAYRINADDMRYSDGSREQLGFNSDVTRMVLIDAVQSDNYKSFPWPETDIVVNDVYEVNLPTSDSEQTEDNGTLKAIYTSRFQLTPDNEVFFREGFEVFNQMRPIADKSGTMVEMGKESDVAHPIADLILLPDNKPPKAYTVARNIDRSDYRYVSIIEDAFFDNALVLDGMSHARFILRETAEQEPHIINNYDN